MFPKISPVQTKAWLQLYEYHGKTGRNLSMKDLFRTDPDRFNKYSLEDDDIIFDYSKNIVTAETLALLFQLAE